MRLQIEDAQYLTRVITQIESGELDEYLKDESAEYNRCDECGILFTSLLYGDIDCHEFAVRELKNDAGESYYRIVILIACEGFHQIDDSGKIHSY
jgi:hypothetical protein